MLLGWGNFFEPWPSQLRFMPHTYTMELRWDLILACVDGWASGWKEWESEYRDRRHWENPSVRELMLTCSSEYFPIYLAERMKEWNVWEREKAREAKQLVWTRLSNPYYDNLKCLNCRHKHRPSGDRYWHKHFDFRGHSILICRKCRAEAVIDYVPQLREIPVPLKPFRFK